MWAVLMLGERVELCAVVRLLDIYVMLCCLFFFVFDCLLHSLQSSLCGICLGGISGGGCCCSYVFVV